MTVIGVTQISDSYPNVKYKLRHISSLNGYDYAEIVFVLGGGKSFSSSAFAAGKIRKISLIFKVLYGHFSVLVRYIGKQSDKVYVAYPGILLVLLICLLPRRYRPEIYLDAIISLYDTVVNDRKLVSPSSLSARLLFSIERRAFAAASRVVVDTPENGDYYSDIFSLPRSKFFDVPLSIPPLKFNHFNGETDGFKCVFVGTFVPLQGVPVIVDAAKLLSATTNIEFIIIGDGQDAPYLEKKMAAGELPNVTWYRGHYSTAFISAQLAQANLCLGVFGSSGKTERVLPYKLYYYLSKGMTVVTGESAVADRIASTCRESGAELPFVTSELGSVSDLAAKIAQLSNEPDRTRELTMAAQRFFNDNLGDMVIKKSLARLFL